MGAAAARSEVPRRLREKKNERVFIFISSVRSVLRASVLEDCRIDLAENKGVPWYL